MCCRQPAQALHRQTSRLVSVRAQAATAKAGDFVTVDYTGTLDDGSVFDTSRKEGRTPLEFVVGGGMVSIGSLACLDDRPALKTSDAPAMKGWCWAGSRWQVSCSSSGSQTALGCFGSVMCFVTLTASHRSKCMASCCSCVCVAGEGHDCTSNPHPTACRLLSPQQLPNQRH